MKIIEKITDKANSRGDATRQNIIKAAAAIFARDGYDATTTRAIADEAGANLGLIAYHFRNKLGLYLAVFEEIAMVGQARIESLISKIPHETENHPPEVYIEILGGFSDMMIETLAAHDSVVFARLILREQQTPTQAFDIIYKGYIERALLAASSLIKKIKPNLTEEENRLRTIFFFNSLIAIRAGRTNLTRFMGWEEISSGQIKYLQQQIRQNTANLLQN